jgi:hypothetical protein
MSVLEPPRIYFRGQITFDPITTNNYPRNYDAIGAQTVITPDGTPDGTPDAYVQPFREAAIRDVATGSWNPDGTHRSQFFETTVVGVDLGAGLVTTDDPFVGVPVSFLGMLVDTEPYGSISSQLFFDTMSFGIDGGCQIKARRSMRMIARQINFARNPNFKCIAGVASVVWQTSFPKGDGLPIAVHGSKAITALEKSLADNDVLGLTVRWNTYRTVYYDDINCRNGNDVMKREAAKLQGRLRGGGFQPNPARSMVVGVLGLWRKGEPAQVTADRALLQTTNSQGQPNPVATASARLDGNRLVIDLGNSIPETGPELAKQSFGTLSVVAAGKVVATVPSPAYDRVAYESTAGLVTCNLDPASAELASGSDLSLVDPNGTVLLEESAIHVCELTPNVYLDGGDGSNNPVPPDQTNLKVVVMNRSVPVGAGTSVSWVVASTSAPAATTTTTDEQGVATLPVQGTLLDVDQVGQMDCYVVSVNDGTQPPPNSPNPMSTAYIFVRTLPFNSEVAELAPTWKNVYENVLYNWHAMAPCMDNWLRLGDEEQVAAAGPILRKLTAKENFEGFLYMPVTRDLTRGQRTLLYKWLDARKGIAPTVTAAPVKAPDPSQAARSRAFRMG